MVQVPTVEPLSAENVLWANTVLAAGSAIGFVVYTGPETRAVMNTSHPQTKVGLLDLEISQLAKVSRSRACFEQGVLIERRFCVRCLWRCRSRWLR
jgi:magnesium-transporting ATPase (P-type)